MRSRFSTTALPLLRSGDWLIVGTGVLGLAVLAAIALHASADRSLAERGVLNVILAVGHALPLVGLAVALGLARSRPALASIGLLVLGAAVGYALKDRVSAALFSGPGTSYRVFLVDPLACVVSGIMLAPTERIRHWALPPLTAVVGAVIAFSIKLNNPDPDDVWFPAGAFAAAVWSIIVPALLARRLNGRWLQIFARILGSWLIAIGLLLGGAPLGQRPVVDTAPPLVQPTSPWIPEKKLPQSPRGSEPSIGP